MTLFNLIILIDAYLVNPKKEYIPLWIMANPVLSD